MMIPCPFILLDSRIRHPWITTISSLAGQMVLKFIFANIIEARATSADANAFSIAAQISIRFG